jgi:myogenesis-regulating glycosidase
LLVADHLRAVVRQALDELGRPRRVPPAERFAAPIYDTWVEYKLSADQAKVLDFARAIRAHELPAGVIDIDDKWEARYGDFEFDLKRYPDPKGMVAELHRLGFRVTLWVHPYVNVDSRTYAEHQTDGLLLRDVSGKAGLISWWNGLAAAWDFTEPRAGEVFRRRLDNLMCDYGFDGFKFDGGDESSVVFDAKPAHPMTAPEYPDYFVREATSHYGWNETATGIYCQRLGIVKRLIDLDSKWDVVNGLAAVLPQALNASMHGFPFLMPDMVGGNQYGKDTLDAELLVRWAQASALMPVLQFSVGPWHYGPETVRLCRAATEMHLAFAPLIHQLAEAAALDGEPIIGSLVYHYPQDPATFTITDQFMLGPNVIVAPVVIKGATQRDIYLPSGRWIDHKTKEVKKGGVWLHQYPAPLDTLPIFVREGVALP